MTKGVYERCGPEQLQSRRRLLERLQRETWGVKLAVTQDIIKRSLAIGPPALLYSGGRDSTVLLSLVAAEIKRRPNQIGARLIVMHNNTTLGRPGALDWARSFVEKTIKAAKPAEITYIETTVDEDPIAMWARTGYYPVLSKRGFTKYKRAIPGLQVSPVQCCYQLKEKYANAVLRTFRIRVVFWGNRAAESQRRTFGMLDNGMLFKPKKYRWYQSYPLAHWTGADVDRYLKGNNIKYPLAASLETGCLPCCTDITMLPNNSSRLFSQDRPTWERYMRAGIGAQILKIKQIDQPIEQVLQERPDILLKI